MRKYWALKLFTNPVTAPVMFVMDALNGFKATMELKKQFDAEIEDIAKRENKHPAIVHREIFNLKTEIVGDRNTIPHDKPTLVVANHPDGYADVTAFTSFLAEIRPDFLMFGSDILLQHDWIKDQLLPLAVTNRTDAQNKIKNSQVINQGFEYIRKGGCVGLFPAKGLPEPISIMTPVIDKRWTSIPAIALEIEDAVVVPVHIDVCRTPFLQAAERLMQRKEHKTIAKVLAGIQRAKMYGSTVRITIGQPLYQDQSTVPQNETPDQREARRKKSLTHLYRESNSPR